MLVISIQSQVVHGHVGNSAAVHAMQAEGVNVAAVPTTLLSNHPRYPTVRGRVLEAELVADLLKGIEERDLVDEAAVIVTGYLGSPGKAELTWSPPAARSATRPMGRSRRFCARTGNCRALRRCACRSALMAPGTS